MGFAGDRVATTRQNPRVIHKLYTATHDDRAGAAAFGRCVTLVARELKQNLNRKPKD